MWLPSPVYDTFQQCVPSWTTVLLRFSQKRPAKSWSKKDGTPHEKSGPTRTGSGSGAVEPVELDQGHGSTVEQLQGENPIKNKKNPSGPDQRNVLQHHFFHQPSPVPKNLILLDDVGKQLCQKKTIVSMGLVGF